MAVKVHTKGCDPSTRHCIVCMYIIMTETNGNVNRCKFQLMLLY
jgi:hypothetical protein